MNTIDVPIIGDSNDFAQDDPEYTLNLYAEKIAEDVLTLKPTPGSVLDSQLSVSGGGRGIITVAGRLFGVRGGYFQERVDGVWIIRGQLSTTSGKVGMAFNVKPDNAQAQIIVVDDSHGYVYDLDADSWTSSLTNFVGGGSQVAYCSGRAVVFKPDTTFFQWSALYDFTSWSDTANTAEQSLATPIVAVISNGDLLYFFSSDGFAVWQAADSATAPYRQILAGDKVGILAPHSALFFERFAYWLGKTSTGQGVVYRHAGGGRPERITGHATERLIASLSTPSDAVAWSYTALGHVFYVLSFGAGNKTTVYDDTTKLWHDRAQREPLTGDLYALPYVGTVNLDGQILAIDGRDGKVDRIDDAVYTDRDNPIVRERITGVIPREADWLTYFQSVELFGQVGNTPIGQDDPQLMMRYSMDRGMTWSLEEWQQAGGNSSYEGRTRWTGLGAAYGLAFWFKIVAAQYISWRMIRVRAE